MGSCVGVKGLYVNDTMQPCFLVPPGVFALGSLPQSPYCTMYVHTRAHTDSYDACRLDFEVNEDATYIRYVTAEPPSLFLSCL